LLEAETNKYCPGGNDIGAISNLITWVLDFFLSAFAQFWDTTLCTLHSTMETTAQNFEKRFQL
jgi:hypothetical protein